MKRITQISLLSCVFLLAACGTTTKDRALSGGAIGAGAGAVGAAILDTNVVAGAVIGAGVGAATGVATK